MTDTPGKPNVGICSSDRFYDFYGHNSRIRQAEMHSPPLAQEGTSQLAHKQAFHNIDASIL